MDSFIREKTVSPILQTEVYSHIGKYTENIRDLDSTQNLYNWYDLHQAQQL